MALRLAEVFLPEKGDTLLDQIKSQFNVIDSYYSCGNDGGELKLLLEAETAEPVFDFLEKRYGRMAGFRIMVVAVEAVIPRLKDEEETQKSKTKILTQIGSKRIYREELYEDIKSIASGSRTFYLMVFLASCVAAVFYGRRIDLSNRGNGGGRLVAAADGIRSSPRGRLLF
jgi:hypothetical protein